MLVLVCGSRMWRAKDGIKGALRTRLSELPKNTVVVSGAAQGADLYADQVASELGYDRLIVPANWTRHGKMAGPIRNRVMLDMKPELVLAYPYPGQASGGTFDTVTEARRRGIEVEVWMMGTDLKFRNATTR